MATRTLRPALVLAAWTALVWTARIRNIWTDDSLSTSGQVWRTALAVVFTAFAVAVIAAWFSARRTDRVPASAPVLVRAFTVWTAGVWAVRAVQIGLADHGVGFKVVHTVLALVSVGLALWADRETHRAPRSEPVSARP